MHIYYTSKQLETKFQRSAMTIARWTDDPHLGFPKPLRIRRRKLWSAEEVEQWERKRANGVAAGA